MKHEGFMTEAATAVSPCCPSCSSRSPLVAMNHAKLVPAYFGAAVRPVGRSLVVALSLACLGRDTSYSAAGA